MSSVVIETSNPSGVSKEDLELMHNQAAHDVARGYAAIEEGTLHLDPDAHEAIVELEKTTNATTD